MNQVTACHTRRANNTRFTYKIGGVRIISRTFKVWIAAAGSTFFGHTTEHSPTKVHSHTPDLVFNLARRWSAPSSRVSRMYRRASADAAGPTNSGLAPKTGHAA